MTSDDERDDRTVCTPRDPRYPRSDATAHPLMIGLSVAIGRFVEALFWAIFRIAGAVAGVAILAVAGLLVVAFVARRLLARKNR